MKLFELLKRNVSLEQMPGWALKQGVSSLLYDEIVASGVNPLDRRGLMLLSGYAQKQIGRWELQKESINTLARFCEKNGIGMMIFKGYALSLLFDVPTSRKPGDVDVWFFRTETKTKTGLALGENEDPVCWPEKLRICDLEAAGDKVDELLRSKGVDVVRSIEMHTVFDLRGSHYENHSHFLESEDNSQLLYVEEYLQKQYIVKSEEWNNVYYPSPNFDAIFLPLHAGGHFVYEGSCLKQLVDWPMFLKHSGNDVNWNEIYSIVEKIGMNNWIDVLNAIAVDMFDIPVDCIGGEQYLHRNTKLEWKVFDAFSYNESVKTNETFLKYFYLKTRKQIKNRWKVKLVFNETLIKSYVRHCLGYIKNKIRY